MSFEAAIHDALERAVLGKPTAALRQDTPPLLRALKQPNCRNYNEYAAISGPLMTALTGFALPFAGHEAASWRNELIDRPLYDIRDAP